MGNSSSSYSDSYSNGTTNFEGFTEFSGFDYSSNYYSMGVIGYHSGYLGVFGGYSQDNSTSYNSYFELMNTNAVDWSDWILENTSSSTNYDDNIANLTWDMYSIANLNLSFSVYPQQFTQIDEFIYIAHPIYENMSDSNNDHMLIVKLPTSANDIDTMNFGPISMASYSSSIPYGSSAGSCVTNNGSHIFVIGGYNPSSISDSYRAVCYNPSSDMWHNLSSLNDARMWSGCAVDNYNNVFVFGGYFVNTIEYLNYEEWHLLGDYSNSSSYNNDTFTYSSLTNLTAYFAISNSYDNTIILIADDEDEVLVFDATEMEFVYNSSYGNVWQKEEQEYAAITKFELDNTDENISVIFMYGGDGVVDMQYALLFENQDFNENECIEYGNGYDSNDGNDQWQYNTVFSGEFRIDHANETVVYAYNSSGHMNANIELNYTANSLYCIDVHACSGSHIYCPYGCNMYCTESYSCSNTSIWIDDSSSDLQIICLDTHSCSGMTVLITGVDFGFIDCFSNNSCSEMYVDSNNVTDGDINNYIDVNCIMHGACNSLMIETSDFANTHLNMYSHSSNVMLHNEHGYHVNQNDEFVFCGVKDKFVAYYPGFANITYFVENSYYSQEFPCDDVTIYCSDTDYCNMGWTILPHNMTYGLTYGECVWIPIEELVNVNCTGACPPIPTNMPTMDPTSDPTTDPTQDPTSNPTQATSTTTGTSSTTSSGSTTSSTSSASTSTSTTSTEIESTSTTSTQKEDIANIHIIPYTSFIIIAIITLLL